MQETSTLLIVFAKKKYEVEVMNSNISVSISNDNLCEPTYFND